MRLSRADRDRIVWHARECFPRECVGVLGGVGDHVTRVFPAKNETQILGRFSLSYAERKRLLKALVNERLDLVAVYHSHPNAVAYPSTEDIAGSLAIDDEGKPFYEGCAHVIVSLYDPDAVVRAFRIRDRAVSEEPIVDV